MKLKKISAILLSLFMLAGLSACEKGGDSSSKADKEIIRETVAVENSSSSEAEDLDIDSESSVLNGEIHEDGLNLSSSDDNTDNKSSDSEKSNDSAGGFENISPQETIISILEKGFKTSFNENIEITYDEKEKNYNISVWQEGYADALETEQGAAALDTISSSLETALDSMVTQIRMLDNEANLTFNFVSDKDKSKVLFTIYNGKMTYCITQK